MREAEPDRVSEPLNESLSNEDNDSDLDGPTNGLQTNDSPEPFVPTYETGNEESTEVELSHGGNESHTKCQNGPSGKPSAPRETQQYFARACWPDKMYKGPPLKLIPKRKSYEYVPTQKTTRSGRSIKPITRFSSHRY